MSGKRRATAPADYVVNESSSEDDDRNDEDFDISSCGRQRGRMDSIGSNGSSEPRRRGRGVSKRPCLNRNALMARENRQRKKEYLEKIESKLSFYRQENKNLSNVIQRQDIDLKRLKAEVSYLKNILHNNSTITTLLKSMNDTLSVKKNSQPDTIVKAENTEYGKFSRMAPQKSWNSENAWKRGGKYIDRNSMKREATYDLPVAAKRAYSVADSDHTYTSRETSSSLDEKMLFCADTEENGRYNTENGALSPLDGLLLAKEGSATSLLGISDQELDDLPPFDANLFESLSNDCIDIDDSLDCLRNGGGGSSDCLRNGINGTTDCPRNNVSSFNGHGNLIENLENTGICLHVNSGKISLEFCSICHLNSINSSE